MGRVYVDIPEAIHERFREAVARNSDGSQVNVFKKLIRAYAENWLWFERTEPRISEHFSRPAIDWDAVERDVKNEEKTVKKSKDKEEEVEE